MRRRNFLGSLGMAAALPFTCRAHGGNTPTAARRPNILIIQPDQHSSLVIGCSGNDQVYTPHLDALARQSVFFNRAVSNSPVCSPCRSSMQSGLYWHTHGVDANNVRLNPGLPCFAESLDAARYRTGYIGKWHIDGGIPAEPVGGFIPPGPRRQGWREWWGYEKSHEFFEVWRFDDLARKERVPEYNWEPTWQSDMALDFVGRHEANQEPWCYYLGYGPPHKPEQCKQEFLDLYDPAAFTLTPAQKANYPDETKLREVLQMYYAQVTAVDHEVGRVLQELERLGAAENTIVLYFSDHGDVLGSHGSLRGKSMPYATSFRVPTMIRWPAQLAPRITDALIGTPDLPATLLDLAGVSVPPSWQGISFAPLCRGETQSGPDSVPLGLQGWQGVWDGHYVYSEGNPACLYDHQEDPFELKNLIHDTRLAKIMQDKMHTAMLATGHPEFSGSRT